MVERRDGNHHRRSESEHDAPQHGQLGLLYLHGGVWEGEQLLPADWIETSLTPQNERLYYPPSGQVETIEWLRISLVYIERRVVLRLRSFQAAGYAGQQVLVLPELDLMLVTTANLAGVTPEVDIQQRTALNELFLEVIFPALADVELER